MEIAILDIVYKLGHSKHPIPFSEVPLPLYQDFRQFMVGKTFVKRGGEFAAYPVDFKAWLRKLSTAGINRE